MCDVLTKLFFLLASLHTLYCVHSWSACESTSRHTHWICVSLDQWVIQRVIFNPQSPKNTNKCTQRKWRTEGKLNKPTRTCTSVSKHAHTLMHFPWTHFNFSSVWLGGNHSHVSVCWRCTVNIWKQCCVSSFVCSWGLLAKLLVKHFGQKGERVENMCPPPTSLTFLVSLPFWGDRFGWTPRCSPFLTSQGRNTHTATLISFFLFCLFGR